MSGAPRPSNPNAFLAGIYATFLAVLIAVVVGVGLETAYPDPSVATTERVMQLYDDEAQITGCDTEFGKCLDPAQLTAAQREQLRQIAQERAAVEEQASTQQADWNRNTMVILLLMATALMVASLLLPHRLAVLSNGMLLGGLLVML